MVDRDEHHPFHYAKEWLLRPQAEYIRQTIVARGLGRAAHNALHMECSAVPVPGYHTLGRVARNLTPGLPVLEGIDEYCFQVEQSNRHYKIKPFEIALNNLSVQSLRQQIPFIQDGMQTRSIIL